MAIKDSVTKRLKKPEVIYSKLELQKFGESFNKYKKKVVMSTGEEATVPDWEEIYFRAGVKTRDGKVTWHWEGEQKVFPILKFEAKYRQWRMMLDGIDYAEQKRMEQLENMSQQEIEAEEDFAGYNIK